MEIDASRCCSTCRFCALGGCEQPCARCEVITRKVLHKLPTSWRPVVRVPASAPLNRGPLSADEIQQVRDRYPYEAASVIAADLDRRVSAICRAAMCLRLRKVSPKKPASGGRRYPWTDAQKAEIVERYPHERTQDLADSMGIKKELIHSMANRLGVAKSEEFMAGPLSGRATKERPVPRGADFRFKPGHSRCWNKGTKGVCKPNSGSFKAGQMPHNHLPVGSMRPTTDGFMRRKIAEPNVWEFVHIRNWLDVHGEIPKGFVIEFADRDRSNFDVSNLKMVSLVDHMRGNSINRLPEELRDMCRLLGRLNRRINAHGKE